jgi:SAM-dependent methyltransferase
MIASPFVMATPDGEIELTPAAGGRTRITLRPCDPGLYVPRRSCETSHPEEIEIFLNGVASFAWLCDAISRHEEPGDVPGVLKRQLFAHVEPSAFRGARMLDFGCGSGASTFTLETLLPETEIIGVELDPVLVERCRDIAARRRTTRVHFFRSPSGDGLPPQIGSFDFVMFCATYEHLLPHERRALMPAVWETLNPGGVLFINQTPHRWVPYEHHSTGLWGINYLPDPLAHWYARHFARMCPEINRSKDWSLHLRGGVRGGTERGIIADLTANSATRGVIVQPNAAGHRDRADYWLAGTSPRLRRVKRGIASAFRLCDRLFDTIPAFNVDVAIRKELPSANLRAQARPPP